MSANNTVKIALITGYLGLGAGKTTLLNHILANDEGIRAAVIVNDIGEVNVDADLIEKGGIVTQENSNLVPLTNGCICCTLRDDLANQLRELAETKKYDYIIIEASGICEPIPIAQTIADICEESTYTGLPMELDNIIAVVDCARMHDEFEDGRSLTKDSIEEEDIENLLIQQLEFCNTVLLNKVDMVTPKQLGLLKEIVRSILKSPWNLPAGSKPSRILMMTMKMSMNITTTMMTTMTNTSITTIMTMMTTMTSMNITTIMTMMTTMMMTIIMRAVNITDIITTTIITTMPTALTRSKSTASVPSYISVAARSTVRS